MRRLLRGFVLPLLLAMLLFAALLYFVFPTRTWLDQRAEAAEVDARIVALTSEQEALRSHIDRLRTDEEIERIARLDYNLVFPGEESYAILPAPPAPVTLPTSWPFTVLHEHHN